MFKRWASFILITILVLSTTVVFADAQQGAKVYEITVTEAGGKYDLGNVELIFKKDTLEKNMQPVTFTVALYAENGVPYIDIEPSIEKFAKKVTIKVDHCEIQLYDKMTEQTVNIPLNKYNLKVKHFSRYILID